MPVAHVQQNSSRVTDAGHLTHSLSTLSNTTSPNLIVGTIWWTNTTSVLTGVTVQGNAATLIDNPKTISTLSGASFYFVGVASAACSVVATFNANVTDSRMVIHEASGVLSSSDPLDVHAGQGQLNPAGADSLQSGSVTMTQDGEYVFGSTGNLGSGATVTAGTGFTIKVSTTTRNSEIPTSSASAGAINATFTPSGNEAWTSFIATFKAADGGSSNALWAQSLM